jgi:hypothetical protein
MIRIDNPEGLGPALGQVRTMLQIGRRELARHIADATGRDARAINSQLWGWEHGDYAPNPTSLGPLLDALGYQLSLVPLIEGGPEAALSGPVAAEPPTAGVLGRPEGQKTAHGAPGAICGHCGEPQRGYASLWGIPLCHPDEGLDCYRLVTVHGHGAPCLTQPCYDPHPTQEAR